MIRLSAENDRSHLAVLTAMVKAICSYFSKVGNASLREEIACRTSLMLSRTLAFKVLLAKVHSIDSISLCPSHRTQLVGAKFWAQESEVSLGCRLLLPSYAQGFCQQIDAEVQRS